MQCVRKLSLYQVLLLVSTAWKKSINVGCTVSKDWLGIPFLVGRLPHTNDVLYRESSLSRDSRFPLIKEQISCFFSFSFYKYVRFTIVRSIATQLTFFKDYFQWIVAVGPVSRTIRASALRDRR